MELLLPYFIKMNGLLVAFYLTYYFFLRKNTFFTYNRWFLLTGLVCTLGLPFITYTKIIWVEPKPISLENLIISHQNPIQITQELDKTIDWTSVFIYFYIAIFLVFILKLSIELISFFKIIKNGTRIKENKITMINQNKNDNPFSFFSYIVFNRNLFTKEELEHIILHEKVHVSEKHSVDVLISKIFCALFWANPFMWLYHKAILQNLEYIADAKAFSIIDNKINYQKTLVKVVTHQHNFSITNQFYQSLIKKRIVMLQKQKTKQQNVWKYALILPLITGFFLFFQVETVAQVKEKNLKNVSENGTSSFSSNITKDASDEDLEILTQIFSRDNVVLKIYDVKRNKNKEIVAIKIKFYKGTKIENIFERKSSEPIKPIKIFVNTSKEQVKTFGIEDLNETESDNVAVEAIEVDGFEKSTEYWTLDNIKKDGKDVVLIINGQIQKNKQISKLPLNEELDQLIELSDKEFEKKYNQKAEKDRIYYEVTTKQVPLVIGSWEESKKISEEKINNYNIGYNVTTEVNENENHIRIEKIKNNKNVDYKKALIIYDGKVIKYNELEDIDELTIASLYVSKATKYILEKYGEKGKYGVIELKSKKYLEENDSDFKALIDKNKLKKEAESKVHIE